MKQYDVIIADPPWRYDFSKSKNRKIENQYPTMSIEEIKQFGSRIPANKDCVLYLWVPGPKLKQGFEVLDAWGFEYKSQFVWDKKKIGMGYWNRSRHENVLVATRGHVSPPEPRFRVGSIIEEPRPNKHSKKPMAVHRHVDTAFAGKNKLELFARETMPGWDVFGNEVEDGVKL